MKRSLKKKIEKKSKMLLDECYNYYIFPKIFSIEELMKKYTDVNYADTENLFDDPVSVFDRNLYTEIDECTTKKIEYSLNYGSRTITYRKITGLHDPNYPF